MNGINNELRMKKAEERSKLSRDEIEDKMN